MKKFFAVVLFASTCSLAAAQTGGVPPEQTPAGSPGKLQTQKQMRAAKAASNPTTDSTPVAKTTTATGRHAARKAKRAAKVGDKPLN